MYMYLPGKAENKLIPSFTNTQLQTVFPKWIAEKCVCVYIYRAGMTLKHIELTEYSPLSEL